MNPLLRLCRAACLAVGLAVGLAACEKAAQDMYDQPKYKPFRPSNFFADGNSARTPPPDSIPYAAGAFAGPSSGRVDTNEVANNMAAEAAQTNPYPLTLQLLKRGQERYTIYCVPCHSPAGDGDGLVARRGFPHPPSYHSERLRQAPDRHFYDVMSQGYGVMYSYADRVTPPDRWAIVAYIRALQLSQNADASRLPPEARARLASSESGAEKGGQAPAEPIEGGETR